jgi:hypothetical protein
VKSFSDQALQAEALTQGTDAGQGLLVMLTIARQGCGNINAATGAVSPMVRG